jgi:uncharacterized protein YcbK (DUF882 family)
MSIKNRVISIDDHLECSRVIEVSCGYKKVKTPKRALSASKGYDETILKNRNIRGFVEIYRRITRERLLNILNDISALSKISNSINYLLRKARDDEITIGIIEYDAEGTSNFTTEEIETLFDILNNPRLDIIVPPIIPRLSCEDYIRFLEKYIDVYRSSSFNAVLVPLIPHYSTSDIGKLFAYYIKKDQVCKNFICVDFNGSNAISQYAFVSKIVRESLQIEKEYGEPCVRYAINLKYGKATKKEPIVPAKDIVIFAMGFNIFGSNHKRIARLSGVGNYDLMTKIFNRDDYGYYNLNMVNDVIRDADHYEIKISEVLKDRELTKIYNAEKHGLEALEILSAINEGRLSHYIKSKSRILEDKSILKRIFKVNKVSSEASIEEYLYIK